MKKIILLLVIISGIAFLSCKDEITKPTETKERKLQILTYQKDCNTNICSKPVSSRVTITEKDISGADKQVYNGITQTNGSAVYNSVSSIFGTNLSIEAVFDNMLQTKNILLCATDTIVNFCFDCVPPIVVCCDDLPLDTTIKYTFVNELGNSKLVQNNPAGIGKYTVNLNLFTNGCTANDMTITVPTINLPFQFSKISPQPNGNSITLKPGQTLSVTVDVLTKDIGKFLTDINNVKFTVLCNGKTSIWRLNLNAEVIESKCECPATSDTVKISHQTPVAIGSSETYNDEILKNNSKDCDYTINSVNRISSLGAFSVKTTKTIVKMGETLDGEFTFTPKNSKVNEDLFEINYTLSNGLKCKSYVKISGIGCNPNVCGFISGTPLGTSQIDRSGTVTFTKENCNICPYDTAFKVVSLPNTYFDNISVYLPDTVCNSKSFTVTIDQNDFNKFTLNSSSFTLNPGESQNIPISFVAPTKLEFQKMRPGANKADDSCFVLRFRIVGCGKTQIVTYKVCITNFGKYSNILSMFAYNQTTYGIDNNLTYPDYKVCLVNVINTSNGELGMVMPLANPVGSRNAPPPAVLNSSYSDFIINPEVDSDTTAQGPPQKLVNPSIQLVKNSCRYKHIKLYRSNISGSQFADKTTMSNNICGLGAGFFNQAAPRIATGISAGDVYVIYSSELNQNGYPCLVALIHVISVDNGSYNIERRCGISFRLFWPIDC